MLTLQYFGHYAQSTDSLAKTVMLGKIEGRRRRGRQRMDGTTDTMDVNPSKLREAVRAGRPVCCGPWGHGELDTTEGLNNGGQCTGF